MGALETIGEILEFAVAREIDSSEFYKEMADRMEKAETRELFAELAKVELGHKAALELELMKEGLVATTAGRIEQIDSSNYIVDSELRKDMGYEDVLVMAIAKERASFRFYVDLVGMFEESDLNEVLLSLAEEEARHKAFFEIEYAKLVEGKA